MRNEYTVVWRCERPDGIFPTAQSHVGYAGRRNNGLVIEDDEGTTSDSRSVSHFNYSVLPRDPVQRTWRWRTRDIRLIRVWIISEQPAVLFCKVYQNSKHLNIIIEEMWFHNQERPSPKPMMHIAYSPYFNKIYKFSPYFCYFSFFGFHPTLTMMHLSIMPLTGEFIRIKPVFGRVYSSNPVKRYKCTVIVHRKWVDKNHTFYG